MKRAEQVLRKAIEDDEKTRTRERLAADAEIAPPQLHHFIHRTRTLKFPAVAALIDALGLELRPARCKRPRSTRVRKPKTPAA